MTPVAKRPSLRRRPHRNKRISKSESSRPQPVKQASKPSTRSRSERQTARLQEREPRHCRGLSFRGAKAAILLPYVTEWNPQTRSPALHHGGGHGARAIIRDHDLESTIALARQSR